MKRLLSRLVALTPNNTITRNKEALSRLAAKVREAERIQEEGQQKEAERNDMTRYPGLLTAGEWIALAFVIVASVALLIY